MAVAYHQGNAYYEDDSICDQDTLPRGMVFQNDMGSAQEELCAMHKPIISTQVTHKYITSDREPKTSCCCQRGLLYYSVIVLNLLYACTGQCYVWTSPTLPYLQSEDSFLPISKVQGSYIASLFVAGGVLGAFCTRPLADTLGRRATLILCSCVILASWGLLWAAPSLALIQPQYALWGIYIARVVAGVAVGVIYSIAPIYTAEIADDKIRGSLNSWPLFSRSVGYVSVYVIGPYTSYRTLTMVGAGSTLVCLMLSPWLAESPHYSISRGHYHRAVDTVLRLRRGLSRLGAEKEVNSIQEYINKSSSSVLKSFKDLCGTRGNIRALYLSGGLLAFQQLSGVTVIIMYTEPIFQETGVSTAMASQSAILVGSTMMFSATLVPRFVKRWGFIFPMIVSALGSAIFVGLLGLYFFLKASEIDVAPISWLPVTTLFLYTISYTMGIGTLPWAVMGEMFPSNTKSLAAGILTAFNFFLGFLTSFFFVEMNQWVGIHWSFWMYAAFCASAAPFTKFLLPDTKGLSLDQIQQIVNRPWNCCRSISRDTVDRI
ncbi:facilitated trehalose transporter Tret1-2 homolog [Macrosteles quadrilineatus]|uniref:facilitated trehalose transporter Tret1-2 homolog n=1 Tax=Macrosteles quadrilineatus TaxID=74068 RepID=UPI0023E1FE68|nr:facilitated trehalose transporter Tret1-2 homolog [Macrosteles quadrilineatus]